MYIIRNIYTFVVLTIKYYIIAYIIFYIKRVLKKSVTSVQTDEILLKSLVFQGFIRVTFCVTTIFDVTVISVTS